MAPAKPIVGKKRKYFTVEEANNALPLVRMIVGDIVRQYRIVEDLQQRLSMVSKEHRKPSKDLYAKELAQSQAELDTEEQKLMAYIEELKRLGVEFKGPDGLCDFYSMMDGREVFLCSHWAKPTCRTGTTSTRDLPAGNRSRSMSERRATKSCSEERSVG